MLFVAGYLTLTFSFTFAAIGFSLMYQAEKGQAQIYMVGLLFVVFAIFIAWFAIELIKKSFLPGLSPRTSFENGQLVQFVKRDEQNCALYKIAPFTDEAEILQVRDPIYADNSPEAFHYRYYFDGSVLRSAIK